MLPALAQGALGFAVGSKFRLCKRSKVHATFLSTQSSADAWLAVPAGPELTLGCSHWPLPAWLCIPNNRGEYVFQSRSGLGPCMGSEQLLE